jgi:hypothetical protein
VPGFEQVHRHPCSHVPQPDKSNFHGFSSYNPLFSLSLVRFGLMNRVEKGRSMRDKKLEIQLT